MKKKEKEEEELFMYQQLGIDWMPRGGTVGTRVNDGLQIPHNWMRALEGLSDDANDSAPSPIKMMLIFH